MKKIAIITVALMMTAPVTFALPAAADQLKVGTSVKLERDAQLPSCHKVDDAIAMELSTHFITKAFNDYMNAKPGKCSVMMGLYHGHYQVTDASPHFAGDGSRIDSHRWYRLCNRYEGCSWVLRDDRSNTHHASTIFRPTMPARISTRKISRRTDALSPSASMPTIATPNVPIPTHTA